MSVVSYRADDVHNEPSRAHGTSGVIVTDFPVCFGYQNKLRYKHMMAKIGGGEVGYVL